MILLLRHELARLARRVTPYVVLLAITALILMVVLGFYYDPPGIFSGARAERKLNDVQVVGNMLNGLLICQFVLKSLALLLPYLAPVVAGEILGAEGGSGTLRALLTRPRSRSAVFGAKFLAAAAYTLLLCAFTMGVSLLLGWLAFGWGQLFEFEALQAGRVVIFTEAEALRFLALAYLLLALAVFVTSSLGLALGSFFDNGLVPGFVALGLVIVLQIAMGLPFEWAETVRPYLFTSQLAQAPQVMPTNFDPETLALQVPWDQVIWMLKVCGVSIAVFTGIGWWRFVRKDITC
ncbi:MAG: ABC transporter permease subunit [Fimbriimonadaceae bacterium]|nr:ABC transporter permease subunit [Fimbriimonadaceae bacterium]